MPDIPLLERTLLNLTAIHLDTILNSGRKGGFLLFKTENIRNEAS